jgi:16S rRNA (cytosine967-C5)-methyltransferase
MPADDPAPALPAATGLAARSAAWRVLEAVAAGAYADAAMDRELGRHPLPPLDRALATELAYGAIRQRRLLDAWIDAHGRVPARRQPPRLRWLLHLGLYQLLFSERVPASAAVSTTVELAKRAGLGRLAPVANALLRAVQRRRLEFAAAAEGAPAPPRPEPWQGLVPPADPAAAFAVRHSLPDWLAAELLRWLPPATAPGRAEAFARSCNAPPPLDLRVNPLRSSREEVRAALAAVGHAAAPLPDRPQGLVLTSRPGDLRALPGYREGHWCVQDRNAQRIAPLLEPRPGMAVLDACAAPGGKTTHIAELMHDRGEIWAVDRSEARLRRLGANAGRLGLGVIRTLAADACELPSLRPEWRGHFDRILLDVPCSGLGTLARHPDARWRIDPAAIEDLLTLQSRLLDAAAPLLAPGGRLVYGTCTVHPRENGEQITAFLARHPRWEIPSQRQWWPGEEEGGGDGFYAAVLALPLAG